MGRVRDKKNRASHKTIGQAMARRRLLLQVREEAAEFAEGLKTNADPAEAVQFVLDQMMSAYHYATQKVMELPEDEYFIETISGKKLNEWIVEQERLGLQIVHTAGRAASMGLAERQVRLQEQQAAIFATVVDAVLVAAGLTADKRREIHQGIATRLEDIEGTAVELSA